MHCCRGQRAKALAIRCHPIICLILLDSGCNSGPGKFYPPSIDSGQAASEAVRIYDRDGDGQLNKAEWSACPAFCDAINIYDTNSDQVLTTQEIAAGIARWQRGEMGATTLPFQVTLGGHGLEGAIVHLVPEKFFGEAIKPATGIAGRGGRGFLGVAKTDMPPNAPTVPLVQPGLYRVEITHPQVKIPAKYNSQTTLGLEVAMDRLTPQGVVWALSE